jgi:hypothetical protein
MSRFVIGATWDDAPHLTAEAKADLWASIPAFQKDARSKGIPQLGSGAIYPFPESDIRVADFAIPTHWPRAFGLDCALGGTTAIVWGALDRDSNTLYLYSVYTRAAAEIAIHVDALAARGKWIHGVGDASGVIDADRTSFLSKYRQYGVNVDLPDKTIETGIQDVYDRLSAGKLKVFTSCVAWFGEYRLYRRDKLGRVVKALDHTMDATRYLVRSGLSRVRLCPAEPVTETALEYGEHHAATAWMR